MVQASVRDRIVEAGREVIFAQGFNGCSVQDITEAAGVPKGSFYNYFKSKEALAVEILGNYTGLCDLDVLGDRTKPPLDRLRSYFRSGTRYVKTIGFERGCLMGNLGCELSGSSEPVRKAVAQRFGAWHRTIAEVLREGQVKGEVNPALDAEQMARFLVMAWEGALLQMKTTKSSEPLEDFLELAFVPLLPRAP